MKKYIVLLGIILVLGISPITFAQLDPAVMPDDIFYSTTTSARWFRNGTAFCYFNGATYAMIWTKEKDNLTGMSNWYPYVYYIEDNDLKPFTTSNSPKLKFGYYWEDEYGYGGMATSDVIIIGKTYGFSYYGSLWFSCIIRQPPHKFDLTPDVYYELWARYDPSLAHWETWYHKIDGEPEDFYIGACQVDSLLHMIYWDGSSASLREDLYDYDPVAQDISYIEDAGIRLPGKKYGGMFAYRDVQGNTNTVYNTYNDEGGVFVTLDGPFIGHHEYGVDAFGLPGGHASAMMQGSAQGKRPYETVGLEGYRFNIFYLGTEVQPDFTYPLYNWEWIIPDMAIPYGGRCSEVTLPSTNKPIMIDNRSLIEITMDLIPGDFSTQIDSTDGLEKHLMVFYPGMDKKINGAIFNSDIWQPVPNSVVFTNDLKDDSLYGPEIRKLWTLVGIMDGAPPCSINWHVWDSTLNLHQHEEAPTKFSFSVEQIETSELKTTYNDGYSIGTEIKVSAEKVMGLDLDFQYAQNFSSMVSSSKTISKKITTNFALNDESQEYGYYLWSIPEISRITYMVYPWFGQFPAQATMQYRFITQGSVLKKENIPCEEFPFLINDPNDPELYDFTQNGRSVMFESANTHDCQAIQTIGWTSPNPGDHFNFTEVDKSISSVDTTTSYSWDESSSFGCPAIFKVSMNSSQDISYSTEYTYETEFGNEVEVSLGGLVKEVHGVNFNDYDVSVYWFKPEKYNWWYLEGMDGQKPWYIGYIVSFSKARLNLLSPEQNSNLRNSDLLFCWEAEGEELYDYKLLISTEPTAGPGSTIYKLSCGNNTAAVPAGFAPEPGKLYYWAVKGFTASGELKWSGSRAFKIGEEQTDISYAELKVSIYPNPAREGQVTIACDLPETGDASVFVYNVNGELLQWNEWENACEGTTVRQIDLSGYAPGIYIVAIQTTRANAVRKLVIR